MLIQVGWKKESRLVCPQLQMKAQSDEPMDQGDKVHRTVRRLLFVIRAARAARDEQLGEHKTFPMASRWV